MRDEIKASGVFGGAFRETNAREETIVSFQELLFPIGLQF